MPVTGGGGMNRYPEEASAPAAHWNNGNASCFEGREVAIYDIPCRNSGFAKKMKLFGINLAIYLTRSQIMW